MEPGSYDNGRKMKPLLDEVDRLINQLPAEDLLRRARFHPEDQKMFGNALVIYDSPKLKIRFIKDRGEIGVDVCAPGKESWWPLDQICEVLGRPLPGLDFDSNARTLLQNYADIVSALAKDSLAQTTAMIEAVQKRRMQEFWGAPS